ncbi:MAG: 16S rRNA (cytidine(1402)-2'-O)-methyltransferase [Pyrinomonadaceae bacterium]
MKGELYLIATPIGNLEDISFRAVETLRSADLIACEDTRRTGKLLKHFEIKAKLLSYHEHNETNRIDALVAELKNGRNIALVSDAGTPGISDPGYRIVNAAILEGIKVIPIPGAAAFISAVIVSGLPTDSIFFAGFLPAKKSERRKRLEELRLLPATVCLYEAPHRILHTLKDCVEVLGNRNAALSRELTKLYEETLRGDLETILKLVSKSPVKGELVLSIDRARGNVALNETESILSRVLELEAEGIERKKVLKIVAKEFGVSRSEAYRKLLEAHTEN